MTTLAALAAPDGRLWLAADRYTVDGKGDLWPRADQKLILKVGEVRRTAQGERQRVASSDGAAEPRTYGLAVAGPTSLSRWLRFRYDSPTLPDPLDVDDCDEWAYTVAEAVTAWASEAHPSVLTDGHLDADVVLAYAGRLWLVREHNSAAIPPNADGWATLCAGSGGDYAKGALAVLIAQAAGGVMEADPGDFVRHAVGIATDNDAYTGGGIDVTQL